MPFLAIGVVVLLIAGFPLSLQKGSMFEGYTWLFVLFALGTLAAVILWPRPKRRYSSGHRGRSGATSNNYADGGGWFGGDGGGSDCGGGGGGDGGGGCGGGGD